MGHSHVIAETRPTGHCPQKCARSPTQGMMIDRYALAKQYKHQFKTPRVTGDKLDRLGRKSPPPQSKPGDKNWSEEVNG